MFAARQGFFPPITTTGGFGNSSFWSTSVDVNRRLSVPSVTNLVTWRATTGFTIEYWVYQTSQWPGTINPGPGNQDVGSTNYWSFGPANSGSLEFYYWGPGQSFIKTATGAMNLDTWYNVCMVATTSGATATVSLYIDGVRQQVQLNNTGTFTDNKSVTTGVISTGTPFRMGRYGGNYWRGYMDNLRVSNINRYSGASYSVQTSPFSSDANTQLLMICDGANGSTTFTDISSFARTVTNNTDLVTISNARANHS